jgi:hypothetical protein
MPEDVKVGDRVELRKPHPCGGRIFTVTRVGMDVQLKCETCGSYVRLMRRDTPKRVKRIIE